MKNRTYPVCASAISLVLLLAACSSSGAQGEDAPASTAATHPTSSGLTTAAVSTSATTLSSTANSTVTSGVPGAVDTREGDGPVIYANVKKMRQKVAETLTIKQCNPPDELVKAKVYVTEQACWLKDHFEQVNLTTYSLKDQGSYLENGGGDSVDFSTYCGVGWTIAVETEPGLRKVLKALDPNASPAETLCPPDDDTGSAGLGATVPRADVQQQIIDAITKAGGNADHAKCPKDLPGTVGAEMLCEVRLNGTQTRVKVVVTRVEGGKAYFNVLPAD